MSSKKLFLGLVVVLCICCTAVYVFAEKASDTSGEKLFMANCKVCHPDGGNIVNPKKTLHKADRDANNVKTAADIVHIMRNPGPGMTKFDEKTIPDKEAHEIASYILKTFNK
ncbi:MAG: c-type cytochrome [Betaproteobacteria bacterium]